MTYFFISVRFPLRRIFIPLVFDSWAPYPALSHLLMPYLSALQSILTPHNLLLPQRFQLPFNRKYAHTHSHTPN